MKAQTIKKALFAAFPITIPVLLGYLFIGFAFGMLLETSGYNYLWALLMSVGIFAGSMQFVTVSFLSGGLSLLTVALMTLMINSRHIFYGLSMLGKFKDVGKAKKAYLVFSLTDETFALLCSKEAPIGTDKGWFLFFIALLNHIYWITGSVIGAVASSLLAFDSTGIDFAMTALFIVILIEQLKSARRYAVALVGAACAVLCLFVFGSDAFILPAMILISAMLVVLKNKVEKEPQHE